MNAKIQRKQRFKKGLYEMLRLKELTSVNDFCISPWKKAVAMTSDTCIIEYDFKLNKVTESQEGAYSLCSYSESRMVYCFENIVEVQPHHRLYGHLDNVNQLQADEVIAISAGNDGLLMLWDLHRLELIERLNFHTSPITRFLWRNSLLVSGDLEGEIALWDINRCSVVNSRRLEKESIQCIQDYVDYVSHNVLAVASRQGQKVNFFDMRTNKVAHKIALEEKNVKTMAINSSGYGKLSFKKVFVAGQGTEIECIDICGGYRKMKPFKVSSPVSCLQSYENLLVAGCVDGSMLVCDNDTKEQLYSVKLFNKPVHKLDFNHDYTLFCVMCKTQQPCLLVL